MKNKIVIVALDNNSIEKARKIVQELKNEAFAFKLGYEFFYNFGIDGYNLIKNENVKIFLDLKLHDIPNTVKKAVDTLSKLDPYFLTIHISGGDEMLKAAILNKKNIKILGVSILTSLNSNLTKKFYFNDNIGNIVSNYTNYAIDNKLDGIVCSPKEIKEIKKISSNKLLIITPGIRPENYNNSNDDQARTMSPKNAIKLGANYLVIGRPITESKNPYETIRKINNSLE
tara:strand:+ start:852 stop:1538 length:687 start_codon:yes stop_codon:yes gene_type:complete